MVLDWLSGDCTDAEKIDRVPRRRAQCFKKGRSGYDVVVTTWTICFLEVCSVCATLSQACRHCFSRQRQDPARSKNLRGHLTMCHYPVKRHLRQSSQRSTVSKLVFRPALLRSHGSNSISSP